MKLSAVAPSYLDEAEQFRLLKRCGFDATDFALRHYLARTGKIGDMEGFTDRKLKKYFTEIKKLADEAGVEIYQTHGHGGSHPGAFEFDYDEMTARCIASIKATHYLGSKYCVIHPVIMPERRYDILKKEAFDKSVEFYRRLIPTLEKYDVYCCIENMFVSDKVYGHICSTILSHAKEMVDMCEVLGDRFRICLDVGHSAVTQDDPAEAVRICGDRLVCLHTHDNDGISDLHAMPYTAYSKPAGMKWDPLRIDWNEFMKALKEIDYKGTFSFEIVPPGPREIKEAGYLYLSAIGRHLVSLMDKGDE